MTMAAEGMIQGLPARRRKKLTQQDRILAALRAKPSVPQSAEEIAKAARFADRESPYVVLALLVRRGVVRRTQGERATWSALTEGELAAQATKIEETAREMKSERKARRAKQMEREKANGLKPTLDLGGKTFRGADWKPTPELMALIEGRTL